MDRSAPSELLIRQRLRALDRNLPAAAKGNVEALHQARVASRRMREALPLVSTGSRGRRLQRQIRKITQALGPVRDLDVALQILDEIEEGGETSRSALGRLRQAVSRERASLYSEMKRRLDDFDLERLRKRALNAARRAADEGTRRDPKRLARAYQRAANRAERLRAAIESATGIYLPDRLHDVRIAVKKLRYAMELARELGGTRVARRPSGPNSSRAAAGRIRTLKNTQDLLGRMRDLEILIARTRAVQGAPGAPPLKMSGELDRLVRRLENECRQLHGHYMSSRHSLLSICDHAVNAAADAKSSADAA
jgi:CHAD domain-containing protein